MRDECRGNEYSASWRKTNDELELIQYDMAANVWVKVAERGYCTPAPGEVCKVEVRNRDCTGPKVERCCCKRRSRKQIGYRWLPTAKLIQHREVIDMEFGLVNLEII